MRYRAFIQTDDRSTIKYLRWLFNKVQPDDVLFLFSYITTSGVAELFREFPSELDSLEARWLVGFDYGRSDPSALKKLADTGAIVKVHDGRFVLNEGELRPRRSFHPKSCFLSRADGAVSGLLVGSGNLSRNGLTDAVEMGTALTANFGGEYDRFIRSPFEQAQNLWAHGEPLNGLLDEYRAQWKRPGKRARSPSEPDDLLGDEEVRNATVFWLEAGYVTRNRGPKMPGNQLDFPRGFHRFFGFATVPDRQRNTVFGRVTFDLSGERLDRDLRLGGNLMEKLTLPVPERYGLGAYDGTVLEFTRSSTWVRLRTFDAGEYVRVEKDREQGRIFEMSSGRLFGYR
jgi:HKD family nuclease